MCLSFLHNLLRSWCCSECATLCSTHDMLGGIFGVTCIQLILSPMRLSHPPVCGLALGTFAGAEVLCWLLLLEEHQVSNAKVTRYLSAHTYCGDSASVPSSLALTSIAPHFHATLNSRLHCPRVTQTLGLRSLWWAPGRGCKFWLKARAMST